MEEGDAPDGGGPRQYRRAEVEVEAVQEAMEVGEAPEGKGPRRYQRAEVSAAQRGEAQNNTGGRR